MTAANGATAISQSAGAGRISRVLVVLNDPDSGLRRLASWWAADGLEIVTHPGPDGLPADLRGFAALALLGGGFMPDDDATAPWLVRERALARAAIDEGLPTLGICLGAQVLALVGGGSVRANHGAAERGSTELRRAPATGDDGIFVDVPAQFRVIENHRDQIVRLPDDAVLLASSSTCRNQAFRIGDNAWGVQFHPEVDAARLEHWDSAALAADGFDRDALVAGAAASEAETARTCRSLADAFARRVILGARASVASA